MASRAHLNGTTIQRLRGIAYLYVRAHYTGYLSDRSEWAAYDATELIAASTGTAYDDLLIDVGTADSFYINGQLLPEVWLCTCLYVHVWSVCIKDVLGSQPLICGCKVVLNSNP